MTIEGDFVGVAQRGAADDFEGSEPSPRPARPTPVRSTRAKPISDGPAPDGAVSDGLTPDQAISAGPSADEAISVGLAPNEAISEGAAPDVSPSPEPIPSEPTPAELTPPEPTAEEHPHARVPERLFEDPEAERRWRSRFNAVRISLPEPARDAPDRAVFVSNATGRFELVCWDASTGVEMTATDRPDGTVHGALSADGISLWWFDDTDGDECGIWRRQPFGSGPGPAVEALPGVPPGYSAGIEVGRGVVIAGFSDDDGTRVHLARDGAITTVYSNAADGGVAGLSRDETIWVLSHSEGGDARYPALRALSVVHGIVVGQLDDGPGRGLTALDFSPIPGDQRLLVGHERHGHDQLGIWDLGNGTFTELAISLPGDLDGCFTADGREVIVLHTWAGRTSLHSYDPAAGRLATIPVPRGVVTGVVARRDGSLWYRHSSAAVGPRLRSLGFDGVDRPLLQPPDGGPADSQAVTDVWVDSPAGRIHALLARPAASGGADGADVGDDGDDRATHWALPTVFLVHGGPTMADDDEFDAERAAFLDAGFAVCQVNYRGSTGYGSVWRDALTARVGHTELADIAAVHDHLVRTGRVDAGASALVGHSWGGYLTLLGIGAQPTRWAAAVAGVPVADYPVAYEDEMEPLRAFDRSLFGGSPSERPDAYADSSPLTWIDRVSTPLLVMAGENDPRCPIRQITNYLDALAARKADYRVYRYQAGHGSMVVDERMRQVATSIAFVREALAR
jgi:dienelactone hydrolase